MHQVVVAPLTTWGNFYVIVGSSAGALTGLTFVVINFITQVDQRDADQGIAAFTTPTVVYFGTVLLVTALLSAPWLALTPPAVMLGIVSLAGMFYTAIVLRRQRRMETYTPMLEDWLWYVAFPFVAYVALLVAAILLPGSTVGALFAIGGVVMLLLFIGIHNAWDLVTFIAVQISPNEKNERKE